MDIAIGVDLYVDMESDITLSVICGSFEQGLLRAPFQGVWG